MSTRCQYSSKPGIARLTSCLIAVRRRFNLNSFLDSPTWVGSGYLGALLDQAQREGYSVFVARPTSEDESSQQALINQFRGSSADQAADDAAAAVGSGGDDADMMQAIQASLASSSRPADSSASATGAGVSTPSGSRNARPGSSNEGKRKKSRRQTDEGIEEAVRASLGRSAVAASSSRQGGTRDTAIDLEDDSRDDGAEGEARPSRSPFLNPALRDQLVQGIDDDGDDFAILPSAALATPANAPGIGRAPGAPARQRPSGDRGAPIEIGDEDDEELDDDDYDDSTLAARDRREEELHQQFTAAAQAFGSMRDNRDYDDEDAELQRALAASMGYEYGAAGGSGAGGSGEALGDDWMAGEDAEEQARLFEQIRNGGARASAGGSRHDLGRRSPTPADVGRIAKMREEAKRKEREEREREERHARGEFTPEPEPEKKAKRDDDSDSDEDEDEEGKGVAKNGEAAGGQSPAAAALSPEELRKMRLARFGG